MSPVIVQYAIMGMIALAVGGVAYVFIMPFLSGERRAAKRIHSVANRTEARHQRLKATETANRKKVIQDTLNELEDKRKRARRRLALKQLMEQAGFEISVATFFIVSGVAGLIVGVVVYLAQPYWWAAIAAAFVGALGLPRWTLSFLRKRRLSKFLEEFPNAIDVVVRGVKAGLPLNDTIRMIASESADPVKSEFLEIVDAQAFGIPISDGLERMYQRVPLPEVNFLTIVIAIQSQSGGNLAEALSNLSRVLRDRKRMKGKIQAMSQEAKSSAAIIAALPLAVMVLVYLTTPQYIALLWQERLGHIMLGLSAAWMLTGVIVMRKMINFDF